jgi:hypothetical protein
LTILLPIQFDELSDHAFLQVYKLALDTQARLIVMATFEPFAIVTAQGETARDSWIGKLEEYTTEKLKKFTNLYPHSHEVAHKHIPIEYVVREKPIWRAIQSVQEDENVDIVAWPYRNFMPIIEIFIPTPDITDLLEHLQSNILVMPAKHELKGVNKLVYATSFKQEELDRMDLILSWKKKMAARTLDLVKVVKTSEEKRDAMPSPITSMELKRKGVDEFIVIQNNSITKGLEEYIANDRSTILTLHLPHRSMVNRLVHFHLSRDLIHKTDLPILLQVD